MTSPATWASSRRPHRAAWAIALLGVAAATLQILDANPAVSQTVSVTALRAERDPGLDPSAAVWGRAREVEIPLTAQQTTPPFGGGSIPAIRVRALHYRGTLYLRLVWDDDRKDDRTGAPEQFADAVAVEFPAATAASVPSVCMGQADGGVNIWQWRADREAAARDRPSGDGYVDDYPDNYPDNEDLDFPAREAGNPVAGARPVQDLVAVGFGTLEPAGTQAIEGRGRYTGSYESGEWAVVLARPFASPGEGRPTFATGTTTDVAFAVWNGREGDRDGKKSVSQFARLVVSDRSMPSAPWQGWWFVAIPVVGGLLVALWLLVRPPKTATR